MGKGKQEQRAEEEGAPFIQAGVWVDSAFTDHDVLLGRGVGVSNLPGNINFRHVVWKYKNAYARSKRNQKRMISEAVVKEVCQLDPPGRFLERGDKKENDFYTVSYERAVEKACQALRENSTQPPKGFVPSKVLEKKRKKAISDKKRRERIKQNEEEQAAKEAKARQGHERKKIKQEEPCDFLFMHGVPDEQPSTKMMAAKSPKKKKKTTVKASKPKKRTKKGQRHWESALEEDVKPEYLMLLPVTPSSVAVQQPFCDHTTSVADEMGLTLLEQEAGWGWPHAAITMSSKEEDATTTSTSNNTVDSNLPPHLEAFVGAIFKGNDDDDESETPQAPPLMAPNRSMDPFELLALACEVHGYEDDKNYHSNSTMTVSSDSPTTVVVKDHPTISAVPSPPRLAAKHSLCLEDDGRDLEIIKEFDPIEAWNSLSGQRKEKW